MRASLLSALGALQLFPENYPFYLRLLYASKIACEIENEGDKIINLSELKKILNNFFLSLKGIEYIQDPAEDLFTTNIYFQGHNYTLYLGTSVGETVILQTLLDTITKYRESFESEFVESINQLVFASLLLSNICAERNGNNRYEKYDEFNDSIFLIDDRSLSRAQYSTNIRFKATEPESSNHSLKKAIKPLTTILGTEEPTQDTYYSNPLIKKPFVAIDDSIILVAPGAIGSSLIHNIWNQAILHKQHSTLFDLYCTNLNLKVKYALDIMFMDSEEIILDSTNSPQFQEYCYKIDTDKIAYIQLYIQQDGRSQSSIAGPDLIKNNELNEKLLNNQCEVYDSFKSTVSQDGFLVVQIIGRMGEPIRLAIQRNTSIDCRSVLLTVDDYIDIVYDGRCDSLTLWKFAGKEKEIERDDKFKIVSTSFLDTFAYYLKSDHSLLPLDIEKPSGILLEPGYGVEIRNRSVQTRDEHMVKISEKAYGVVIKHPSYKSIRNCLIYTPNYFYPKILHVDGYKQPIWICPDEGTARFESSPIIEFSDTIAYWLWQLNKEIAISLLAIDKEPIRFHFRFPDQLESINEHNLNQVDGDCIEHSINDRDISLIINGSFFSIAGSPQNEADRELVKKILVSLGTLIENITGINPFPEGILQGIVDRTAPLGLKKKILYFDTNRIPAFDSKKIPLLRYLQEKNLQEEMDNKPSTIAKYFQEGVVLDQEKQKEICNKFVSFFLTEIRNLLSDYSWLSVLRKVISQYEAVLNRRANDTIRLPTSMACYSDTYSEDKRGNQDSHSIEAISISLRILIEIIAAEPPNGERELSTEDYDALLAKSSLLVNWSFISDYIHHNLVDIPIRISRSGRVYTDKERFDNFFERFSSVKQIEIEERNRELYPKYFLDFVVEEEDQQSREEEIDNAFHAEFGFSLTKIVNLLCRLSGYAFDQDGSIGCAPLSFMKSNICPEAGLENEEIDAALDLLTLKPRGNFENVPDGYQETDIQPWRYHRRLSYIIKPLIESPNPESDPQIFWGARNAYQTADYLIKLITTGGYEKFKPRTQEMRKITGKILNEQGKDFNNVVFEWLKQNSDWALEKQIGIGPKGRLRNELDIGDIDILAFLPSEKIILSIECKSVSFGRIPHDINQELERFHNTKKGKKGYIEMHEERDRWLSKNLPLVLEKLGATSDERYIIKSVIVVSDEIPIKYLRDLPMEIIPFTQLQRDGLIRFRELLTVGVKEN
jgi:hypothetical protein